MGRLEIRTPNDDDLEDILVFDGHSFGAQWSESSKELVRPTLDLERFRMVRDRGRIVGLAGSYGQEVTVPGPAPVRAGGVTWVAVAPTHRRQGLLTRMMGALHDDIDERGEPIAMLTASEGGIYERFGYGIASYLRVVEIDARRVEVRPEFRPDPGAVVLSDLDDPAIPELFDRYRRRRVGEIGRTPAGEALVRNEWGAGIQVALHSDGYVAFQVTENWNDGHPAHRLSVKDFVAITPAAHAALWHTILSVDLVGRITSFRAVSLDDDLPAIVNDQRAIRTTNINDMLWIHLRDVGTALAARSYFTDDRLTVEVDLGDRTEQWRIDGDPNGAETKRVRSKPDLELTRAALGAIYLGGVRPSALARTGRVRARHDETLRRADAFFLADRLPQCSTGF